MKELGSYQSFQNCMKQHITKEQFDELSDKQAGALFDFLVHNGHISNEKFLVNDPDVGRRLTLQARLKNGESIITIGQMIQFLYQRTTVKIECEERESPNQGWYVNHKYMAVELCDALWYAVQDELK